MKSDIAQGLYYGGVICVGRHGELVLHEAVGHAYANQERELTKDAVFTIFSVTKAITNVLVYRAIELGELAFTTRVADVIPEFAGGEREKLTVYNLLTHRTGLPFVFTPKEGMYLDNLDDIIAAICENVQSMEPAGENVTYSPMAAHALLGEMVRRTDPKKRRYRELVEQEILGPLKMKDSAVGLRKDLRERKIVPDFRSYEMTHLGSSDYGPNGAFEEEHAEMPWVGLVSTSYDMWRFAEMLRRGGELDGARILSPRIIDVVTRNQTGERPNEAFKQMAIARGVEPDPAYIGIGFPVRGEKICRHVYGTLTSPRTFGVSGVGSTVFWVDPELDMSFVCLTTGLMAEPANHERFQKLSDIAVSSAL
jgi:CubicO group peptidase (beta-lactamase class C family)